MNQVMHLIIASILFAMTWHLLLKKLWPMQEKIDELGEKIDKFFE